LLPQTQAEETTLPDYAAKITELLTVASRIVRENLKNAAETASKWYKKSKPRTFSEGDLVRVYYPAKWLVGPQSFSHFTAQKVK